MPERASAMLKETADNCRSALTPAGYPELRKLLDRAACDLEAAASIICHNIEIPGNAGMVRMSASEGACYAYPRKDQTALRQAFCDGAVYTRTGKLPKPETAE